MECDEHWDYRPPQVVPDDGQQYDWNEDQYQSTGNGCQDQNNYLKSSARSLTDLKSFFHLF